MRNKLDDVDVSWYEEQKQQWKTDEEISEILCVSGGVLWRWKKKNGISTKLIRGRKPIDRKRVLELFQAGVPGRKIARALGYSATSVNNYLRGFR